MINRMSIERLATNIMKRAIIAEALNAGQALEENERNIHQDFQELADRLGYRVQKIERAA